MTADELGEILVVDGQPIGDHPLLCIVKHVPLEGPFSKNLFYLLSNESDASISSFMAPKLSQLLPYISRGRGQHPCPSWT
eukprot:4366520-Amphidinium_carterae.1